MQVEQGAAGALRRRIGPPERDHREAVLVPDLLLAAVRARAAGGPSSRRPGWPRPRAGRAAPRGRRAEGLGRRRPISRLTTACCRLGMAQPRTDAVSVRVRVRVASGCRRSAGIRVDITTRPIAVTTGTSMARCRLDCEATKPMMAGPTRKAAYPKLTTSASPRPPPT